ncbi:thioredoxin-related transmembrane protein 2 [Histomonas meleagridis]|uniref:thioredoxin-related transmembrane protein 2-like n=1 Tax=Histomonas meleagridis TaxID=135588 RepID=UPI00355A6FA0|nr:thioredoxin-related transmembrane protein 2 [Histomonas meleagridis]KAH0805122.1 thioredoxin-related transmembrane protein 2-like [Histomonas meleagridis]
MAGIMFMFDIKWAIPFTLAAIIVHFGIDPPFFEVTGRVATLQEHLLRPYIATVPECYVLFYTTWEDRCVSVTPVFIQIAEKYSAKNRLFARFDIGKSPKAQEEFKISSTNGTLRQIPTIIHFKDGKEINRLNPNIAGDKLLNLPTIVRHFKLRLPTKEEKFK